MIVDNDIAVENIRRLAVKTACGFSVTKKRPGIWEIALVRTGDADQSPAEPGAVETEFSCGVAPQGERVPSWWSSPTTTWGGGTMSWERS